MSTTNPVGPQPAVAPVDDPISFRITLARCFSVYVLTFAAMALLLGRVDIALGAWLFALPVLAYANLLYARKLGRPWWLGLLCAPLAPFAGVLLSAMARRADVVPGPTGLQESPSERPPGQAA